MGSRPWAMPAGEADVLQVTGTRGGPARRRALARERYLESLRIREGLGDEAGVAGLTSNLGIVAQQQGDAAGGPGVREPRPRAVHEAR